MSQITIRGIDPEIEKEIRKIAKDRRQSINNVISEIIRQKFQNNKNKHRAESLIQFAGGWNREDALSFMDSIKFFEQIDETMW
ncbi:hypothetical protein [Desulfobacterium sp. N47]|uniref:Ribbon-helix-helix protein CopG domain-containing protein n=1 Tax=uncultured Desulfobacterium sp. TaxID=201089 RepID=E1YK66_9BACT|nr:hypothetical protein N47_E51820 [uncultured Desulfobacterium sp.]